MSESWHRPYQAYLFDLDGTLVESSGKYIPPYWGDTNAITENVNFLNSLYDTGKVYIIITTSRSSKGKWKSKTLQQLAKEKIKYHDIIFDLPKVAPLSTRDVTIRNSVYQSVTPKETLRNKMINYLDNNLNQNDNIIIVADSINRDIEYRLKDIFPSSIILRPETNGYLLPELVDSLIVDSLPNKIILESDNFSLISGVSAQMSAQISDLRKVQLFTTYRGNVYENENLSRKHLGDLSFTFTSGHQPLNKFEFNAFQERYIKFFGKPPNREAIRAYDLTLDIVLRIIYQRKLNSSFENIGETEYQENRFWYKSFCC